MTLSVKPVLELSSYDPVSIEIPFKEATVTVDMQAIGRHPGESYTVQDTITGSAYHWSERNFVRLEPLRDVAHVFVLPPADHALQEQLTWREVTDYRP